MNKLIKLIYVNFLSIFNLNQIVIAREDGVKSNFETKAIMTSIILIFYGYIIYQLFNKIPINNNYIILSIGYLISTITCFIINFTNIEPIIFKSNDTDMLFTMPITRQQILFSKLFNIYLKNIIGVAIIMIPILISFITKSGSVTDIFTFIYIITSLTIPFIPIVISSLIIYVDNYFKTKYHNNNTYKIIKYSILTLIIILFI
ncbi:MAG TPA: hypothetical protein DCE23_03880, partial [Firmicutes bacterium]|nr:hypothetical protein [Bacillota bacterium]